MSMTAAVSLPTKKQGPPLVHRLGAVFFRLHEEIRTRFVQFSRVPSILAVRRPASKLNPDSLERRYDE